MAEQLKVDGQERPPTPSASVLVLREGADGPEVLMLERHLDSDFVGGALVFPGGKVDAADGDLDPRHLHLPDDAAAEAARMDVDLPGATALWVAAIRETFEEAGVLLAHHRDGRPVTAEDLAAPAARAARASLIDRGPVADWHAWLVEADLVLDLAALAPWSWWVTPQGVHRRFDTRFFAVALPEVQADVAAHDTVEVTSSRWTSPAAALAAHRDGEAVVIFPTRCNLEDLAGFTTAAAAVADGHARTPPRIEPTVGKDAEGHVVVHHPDGRLPERP